ncbi:hypothetical protein [Neobacillus sp. FSL H8-0543]|uniref:hypothetical protein n=1 Tax=Neobacillus sp. FSL H8-0543 TaxID=2954672 RepID=UPI0031596AC6
MTLLGWFFWGSILLVILVAVILQKKGINPPPEKTESQLSAERQALESNKNNFPGGPGGN